ncbi:conjugal transfer protein TraH [Neisseria weixii]|uniref:Conjugal transfer protein TraH n=1 Tax=Neisseria weixii TaxID=1853276 RepID=A0A3N4N280_9NEIS|nr:conjugal transfer protein TraH [Neisseria weixii]RPD90246.1 conjugal transfer protein TraH [Neisseria weixii]
MKLQTISLFCIAILLSACGQSEEEKFYENANKEMEISKVRSQYENCVRDNRINNTDIDCKAKFPVPK